MQTGTQTVTAKIVNVNSQALLIRICIRMYMYLNKNYTKYTALKTNIIRLYT